MRLRVLGAAAGGGLPQWNCACHICVEARSGSGRVVAKTQDSVALTTTGERWHLLNASPDIHRQIDGFSELHPRAARHSPIASIILTSGDLDHCLGLLSLRESEPLIVFATASVWRGLVEQNVFFRTFRRFESHMTWRPLVLGEKALLEEGLSVTARAVPGKLPIHLTGIASPSDEDNVGLWLRDELSKTTVAYVPGAASTGPYVRYFDGIDGLFFDGTFWSDDELVAQGLSRSRAVDMAHMPIGGSEGSLAVLGKIQVAHRIYTHVNNTNPINRARSTERDTVEEAGWAVAFDGMEISP